MKQDRAALEDRDVSIRQPWHLAKRLVREMLGIPSAKWHALDAIGQSGLFQCPTHTYVTYIAPRHLGNPIEGGEGQVDHSASPSVDVIMALTLALSVEVELHCARPPAARACRAHGSSPKDDCRGRLRRRTFRGERSARSHYWPAGLIP